MDASRLLEERTTLFQNAFAHLPNPRTPLAANAFNWEYLDAGYHLHQALRSYDILEQVNCDFHETCLFDAYNELGRRNPIRISEAYGGHYHVIDEAGGAILADDRCLIEFDEIPDHIADPVSCMWTRGLPRYA
jgi:hypothetical protein